MCACVLANGLPKYTTHSLHHSINFIRAKSLVNPITPMMFLEQKIRKMARDKFVRLQLLRCSFKMQLCNEENTHKFICTWTTHKKTPNYSRFISMQQNWIFFLGETSTFPWFFFHSNRIKSLENDMQDNIVVLIFRPHAIPSYPLQLNTAVCWRHFLCFFSIFCGFFFLLL